MYVCKSLIHMTIAHAYITLKMTVLTVLPCALCNMPVNSFFVISINQINKVRESKVRAHTVIKCKLTGLYTV